MEEQKPSTEVPERLDEPIEVIELDDKSLEETAGGNEALPVGTNTNCGCGGHSFQGEAGANNNNCGCPG